MLQSIGKKYIYFFYILLLFLLSTINNLSIVEKKDLFLKIKIIEVIGLEDKFKDQIKNNVKYLLDKNIYSVNKKYLKNVLNKYSFLENYNVFKVYPSKIIINLKQTDFYSKNNNK